MMNLTSTILLCLCVASQAFYIGPFTRRGYGYPRVRYHPYNLYNRVSSQGRSPSNKEPVPSVKESPQMPTDTNPKSGNRIEQNRVLAENQQVRNQDQGHPRNQRGRIQNQQVRPRKQRVRLQNQQDRAQVQHFRNQNSQVRSQNRQVPPQSQQIRLRSSQGRVQTSAMMRSRPTMQFQRASQPLQIVIQSSGNTNPKMIYISDMYDSSQSRQRPAEDPTAMMNRQTTRVEIPPNRQKDTSRVNGESSKNINHQSSNHMTAKHTYNMNHQPTNRLRAQSSNRINPQFSNNMNAQSSNIMNDQFSNKNMLQLSNNINAQSSNLINPQFSNNRNGQTSNRFNTQFSNNMNGQTSSGLNPQFSNNMNAQSSNLINPQFSNNRNGQTSNRFNTQFSNNMKGQTSSGFNPQFSNNMNGQTSSGLNTQFSNNMNGQSSNGLNPQFSNNMNGQTSNGLNPQFSNNMNGQFSNGLNPQFSNNMNGQTSIILNPQVSNRQQSDTMKSQQSSNMKSQQSNQPLLPVQVYGEPQLKRTDPRNKSDISRSAPRNDQIKYRNGGYDYNSQSGRPVMAGVDRDLLNYELPYRNGQTFTTNGNIQNARSSPLYADMIIIRQDHPVPSTSMESFPSSYTPYLDRQLNNGAPITSQTPADFPSSSSIQTPSINQGATPLSTATNADQTQAQFKSLSPAKLDPTQDWLVGANSNSIKQPVQATSLPVQTAIYPVQRPFVSVQGETASFPAQVVPIPGNVASVAANPPSISSNAASMPADVAPIPTNSALIPANSASIPVNSASMPIPPVQMSSVSATIQTVPDQSFPGTVQNNSLKAQASISTQANISGQAYPGLVQEAFMPAQTASVQGQATGDAIQSTSSLDGPGQARETDINAGNVYQHFPSQALTPFASQASTSASASASALASTAAAKQPIPSQPEAKTDPFTQMMRQHFISEMDLPAHMSQQMMNSGFFQPSPESFAVNDIDPLLRMHIAEAMDLPHPHLQKTTTNTSGTPPSSQTQEAAQKQTPTQQVGPSGTPAASTRSVAQVV